MTRDPSELWDNRRGPLMMRRPGLMEAIYLNAYPELLPHWQGPVSPHEARIADDAMAQLGAVMQAQADWEIEQIERRSGF